MRKLVYYVGVTIDGYLAGPEGQTDFFPVGPEMAAWIGRTYPETLPTHVRSHFGVADAPNQRFDTVVMGLGTYRPGLDAGIPSPYAHLRQYVISTTLGAIDDPAVELVDTDPVALIRRLKAEDTKKDVWLAGGGRLAASVLPEIDALVVKSYPIAAGDGIPAFRGAFSPTAFRPTSRESIGDGTSITWFDRAD
ncbi:dihydrofolate reductase family protein [Cryptosporangium aurantiacum]|uniref:RibD C-terminal domain-containing protein n=1 Tax=Cryptosporangium aurantiacum TaxID=134849 RepID=A0A1M7RMZ9_9ACTN|nr:dihydrofolate reductase family protein [Cryptosporangium aurantiacum]SHN47717.1 RibD C-terminal domain-containing protein [Cryptosporangium aurantiacum]